MHFENDFSVPTQQIKFSDDSDDSDITTEVEKKKCMKRQNHF